MGKAKFLMRHAAQRANQRYGINLPQHDQTVVCKMIQANDLNVVVLKKQTNTRTWCAVWYKERWIAVVYNRTLKCLYTCLPDEVLEPYQPKLDAARKAATQPAAPVTPVFVQPEIKLTPPTDEELAARAERLKQEEKERHERKVEKVRQKFLRRLERRIASGVDLGLWYEKKHAPSRIGDRKIDPDALAQASPDETEIRQSIEEMIAKAFGDDSGTKSEQKEGGPGDRSVDEAGCDQRLLRGIQFERESSSPTA